MFSSDVYVLVINECQPTIYEVFNECLLEQTVTSPTRGKHILDLFFTYNPTLTDNVSILPGLSDHDIIQVLVSTIPSQD